MNINHVQLSNCNNDLYGQLYRLNLGIMGSMREVLQDRYNDKTKTDIAYIREDDKVIAWTMFWKAQPGGRSRRRSVHMYVAHDKRQMGLGKSLVKFVADYLKAARLCPDFYPHDATSRLFYDKMICQRIIKKKMLRMWWACGPY